MTLRDVLRSAKNLHADLLPFDPDDAPADPLTLFTEWLQAAVDAGVSSPQAVTLSTASLGGVPSGRTLLLKDVDERGFWFASLSDSPKGEDLAQNPLAALTMYWREHGRQVRVAGPAGPGPREVSEQDFRARHPFSRAQAMAGQQSAPMPDADEVARRMREATERIDADSEIVPETWNAYVVEPTMIEFWQAAPDHDQLRLRYRREGDGWLRERIWP